MRPRSGGGSSSPSNRPSTRAAPRRSAPTLTFAIVGGGPTGVELAGAIQEIAGRTIPLEYRHIDTRTTRVLLFEGGDRLLSSFAPKLSERARRDLERMGVEVRLRALVTKVTPSGLESATSASSSKRILGRRRPGERARRRARRAARSGRARDRPPRPVDSRPSGDLRRRRPRRRELRRHRQAGARRRAGGDPDGTHAGRAIAAETAGRSTPADRKAFSYWDKGSMAILGKAKAVAEIGRLKVGGFLAWLMWGGIHILFLIGFRNRLQVFLSWFWNWLLNARDARLITGDVRLDIEIPGSTDLVRNDENPSRRERRPKSETRAGELGLEPRMAESESAVLPITLFPKKMAEGPTF